MKGRPSRPSFDASPRAGQRSARNDPRSDPRNDFRGDPSRDQRSDPRDRDHRPSYHTDEEQTPRVQKPFQLAVKQSPYYNLQDAPSPSGRLSDRIQRLKQRYSTSQI